MSKKILHLPTKNWIIVKIFRPTGGKEVLIQSEDSKTVNMLAPYDKQFKKMLGKAKFKFFYAKVDNGSLSLGDEATVETCGENHEGESK